MQKSGCSLCKSENPLYKKIPSEKKLLLGGLAPPLGKELQTILI